LNPASAILAHRAQIWAMTAALLIIAIKQHAPFMLVYIWIFLAMKQNQFQGLQALRKAERQTRKVPEHLSPGIASWFAVAMVWAVTVFIALPLD